MKNTNELADLGGKKTEKKHKITREMKATLEGTRIVIL